MSLSVGAIVKPDRSFALVVSGLLIAAVLVVALATVFGVASPHPESEIGMTWL